MGRLSVFMGPVGALLGAALVLAAGAARAQGADALKGYGQTIGTPQQERELDYGTGNSKGSSVFDATNPIDLMNRMRKASALDDATSPHDAIDAALSDYQSRSQGASPGSAAVKGP